MKAIGIIRRVDDLGRVVIPKEIRRTLKIREGEPLEIFTDTVNGMPCVCFMKYSQTFQDDLKSFSDKVIGEMTDGGDFGFAERFRNAMDAAADILKEFEDRD